MVDFDLIKERLCTLVDTHRAEIEAQVSLMLADPERCGHRVRFEIKSSVCNIVERVDVREVLKRVPT